ncbi:MAG TPA: sigma-70 family RNA polymerase sigma factor [Pirellulales bacterium]
MPHLTARLLAELINRHGAALKLYARQWCRDPDDVVQQALIDLAGIRELPVRPVAWLFAAVRRRAISLARSDGRRKRHEESAANLWFAQRRNRTDVAEAAAEMLAELPLPDREIVIAYLWGRLTFAEIAEVVGTSSSTAQRRYERAIERLREKLAFSPGRLPCPNIEK